MSIKILTTNRRARFEYEILETREAGIELKGTEVKSIRLGQINLSEGFCRISEDMQAMLQNVHIAPYDFGNRHNHDPLRPRRLLLHREEIYRLYGKIREQGLTLIPLKLYLKKGRVKLELGLVKGKKLHDKRETIKRRDAQREVERSLRDSG
ncbi:MAG TPA: SsrA-binding protein SmpB [Deltaproteobacteria bacterium]|jgi:SsrA-binding protein|nr:SsrA-binding protein [Deltaproteobacteria bacterium]HIF68643.1 SsrA-binding protein SmpB [Candidatus Lambdaproteobacteria bacterium]HIL16631.1 SsrA-binding protein SmpB [Deltaproteobacteria bacterium]|tara:strand:- start:3141 stop:3596 length:456 start_codon:yes stop_codon:yes gene_type:complete